jgi:drug/metabolite transporter (DMT)-like permease
MLAVLLALAASFTWGTSNYLAGVETRTRSVWHVSALSQIAAAAAAAVALVATRQAPPGGWDLFLLVLTGVATAAGLVMFYKALAIGTMSVVAPIIAAEVLIPVTAGILLGERPGLHAAVGMVLTVSGVILIARTPRKEKQNRTEAHHQAARKAVILAVLTAVAWGFMLLIYGTVGKGNPVWTVFDTRITSAVVLAGYVVLTGRGLSLKGQNVPVLAAIGILLAVANFLFIVATGIGYLSITSILGSLSPVVVTAYAQVLLHERLAPRQWAGFAAVFAGIVLLSV